MIPIGLCPVSPLGPSHECSDHKRKGSKDYLPGLTSTAPAFIIANSGHSPSKSRAAADCDMFCLRGCQERDAWLVDESTDRVSDIEQSKRDVRAIVLESVSSTSTSLLKQPTAAALHPLKACILAIVWELIECPESLALLGDQASFDDIARLLSVAAVYQAKLEYVRALQRKELDKTSEGSIMLIPSLEPAHCPVAHLLA
jgi:hypothetical protein